MNLPPNIAAFFAAFFPPLSGIAFLLMEKKNALVRFHAMQSVYFGIVVAVGYFTIMLGVPRLIAGNPEREPLLALLVALFLIVWIPIWMVNVTAAFFGKAWEIPVIGGMARRRLAKMEQS
jgi:uncharacterized membrane protein